MRRLRRFWWKRVRRYDCEICHSCGRPTIFVEENEPLSWWHAHDDLWREVAGGPGGLLCMRCFTEQANRLGLVISWAAKFEYRRPT